MTTKSKSGVPSKQATPLNSTKDENGLEAYGRLTEGLHVAGYSFERACANLEWLLEGDRWQLGGRFTDINAFMESLRLGRFRQVAEQRKRIVTRIKESRSRRSATGRSPGRLESVTKQSTARLVQMDHHRQKRIMKTVTAIRLMPSN